MFYVSRTESQAFDDDVAALHFDIGKADIAIFFTLHGWRIDNFSSQNFRREIHVGPLGLFVRY